MKDKGHYKDIISTFGKNAFEKFCSIALEKENSETIHYDDLKIIDHNIFEVGRYDFTNPYPHNGKQTYFIDYLPIHLLSKLNSTEINFVSLTNNIKKYMSLEHKDVDFLDEASPTINMGIITNVSNMTEKYFFKSVVPLYAKVFEENKFELEPNFSLQMGSIDSLLNYTTTKQIQSKLNKFFETYKDGISVNFNDNGFAIKEYTLFQEISYGGTAKTFSPLEMIKTVNTHNGVLMEFEKLLNSDVSEKTLEDFLKTNYQIIFPGYDAISTQLWLRFPELDISNKERRLDIFMRNTINHDWDLFELKKANVPIVKGKDIPNFTAKVTSSIMQLKAYRNLLSQDHVKRTLLEEGIEYSEPNYHLVIGRDPNIEITKWRWLQKQIAEKDLKIKTYDELLREAKRVFQWL